MGDRPFEFVFNTLKMRPYLQNIIDSEILLCMSQPAVYFRKIKDLIGDIFKRFKQLNFNDDPKHDCTVVRNLAYGVSAGNVELQDYKKWSKFHDKTIIKK